MSKRTISRGHFLMLLAAWLAPLTFGLVSPALAQEPVRVFVGNISGLENMDARVAVVVEPDGRSLALMHSTDASWNRSFGKVYGGQVSGNTLAARAGDGSQFTATLSDNQIRGSAGGGQWLATLATSGRAGLYHAREGDEVHLAIVLPDDSWVAGAFNPTTRELLRTWNSRGSSTDWQADRLVIRETPQAPPVQYSSWAIDMGPFASY